MCRFLLIKSSQPVDPQPVLRAFADQTEHSLSPEGDRQKDGWGAAWIESSLKWRARKSLRPIWEDKKDLLKQQPTSVLAVHARSASFPHHTDEAAFLQPFYSPALSFVFNGFLKGVTFPFPLPGKIGSQKIWALLLRLLARYRPASALAEINRLLELHSREIQALNIGLASSQNLFVFSRCRRHTDYYTLHLHRSGPTVMISSEPLPGYETTPLTRGRVHCF